MATLEITIDKKGKVTSKTSGVLGSQCMKADDFLASLGEVKVKKTEEFYDARERVVLINPNQ